MRTLTTIIPSTITGPLRTNTMPQRHAKALTGCVWRLATPAGMPCRSRWALLRRRRFREWTPNARGRTLLSHWPRFGRTATSRTLASTGRHLAHELRLAPPL